MSGMYTYIQTDMYMCEIAKINYCLLLYCRRLVSGMCIQTDRHIVMYKQTIEQAYLIRKV